MVMRIVLVVFVSISLSQLAYSIDQTAETTFDNKLIFKLSDHFPDNPAGAVSTLDKNAIQKIKPENSVDLMRGIPGIHVDEPGASGGINSIYLRGADPNLTLVLIDGVPANDPTNSRGGSYDFSGLDVSSVERIEVIKGPLSSSFGSNAMAGVINIFTHTAESKPHITVRGVKSSGEFAEVHARGSGRLGKNDTLALTATQHSQGELAPGDTFDGTFLTGKWQHEFNHQNRIILSTRFTHSQSTSFPEDSGGSRLATIRTLEEKIHDETTLGASWTQRFNNRFDHKTNIFWTGQNEDINSPGVSPGLRDPSGLPASISATKFNRYSLKWQGSLRPDDNWRVQFGAELAEEESQMTGNLDFGGFSSPLDFTLSRTTGSPFAEVTRTSFAGVSNFDIHAGVRADFPDTTKGRLSPQLGAKYILPNNITTIRGNWGEGFKLPSFFALGHPLVGNPDLLAETSNGFDISVHHELRQGVTTELTYFKTNYRNLIDFDSGPPPQLVNRQAVNIDGVELSSHISLGKLSITPNITWSQNDIVGTSDKLLNRPDWRASVGCHYQVRDRVRISSTATYVDQITDSAIPTGNVDLDSYVRVDFSTEYRYKDWLASVKIDNLFNESYQEAVGFESPGLRARIILEGQIL